MKAIAYLILLISFCIRQLHVPYQNQTKYIFTSIDISCSLTNIPYALLKCKSNILPKKIIRVFIVYLLKALLSKERVSKNFNVKQMQHYKCLVRFGQNVRFTFQ